MDISRSPKEFLPPSGSAAGGLGKSLLLLLVSLTAGGLTGYAGYLILRLLAPSTPAFTALPIGAVTLVLILAFVQRRYSWIVPWYYLLPAIVFLLTFTLFPVVLTVVLAFTDYAGVRNGQLNISSETGILSVDGVRLNIEDERTLDCKSLRNGCNGVRALVFASGTLESSAESLEGTRLTLIEAPPDGRNVSGVELDMPELGFAATLRVTEQEGRELTLERAPPFPPDLSSVTLELDRATIARRILKEEGSALTLDEPLPSGLEAVSIARYNDFGFIGWRNFRRIRGSAAGAHTRLPVEHQLRVPDRGA